MQLRPVIIKVSAGQMQLPLAAARSVSDAFALTVPGAVYSATKGFVAARDSGTVLRRRGRATAVAPAGLADRVANELRRLGREVIVQRAEPVTSAKLAGSYHGRDWPPEAHDFAKVLCERPQVQYAAPSYRTKRMLLQAALRIAADQNVLIVTKNYAEAERLAAETAAAGRHVCVGSRYGQRQLGMAFFDPCSTFLSRMRQCWHLIIFFDGNLLTSWQAMAALGEFLNPVPARLAFGPPLRSLTTDDAKVVELTFGPLIRPQYSVVGNLTVYQVRVADRRFVGPPLSWLDRKRINIWTHADRNAFIIRLAHSTIAAYRVEQDSRMGGAPPVEPAGLVLLTMFTDSESHASQLRSANGNSACWPISPWPVESTPVDADVVIACDGLQAAWPNAVRLSGKRGAQPQLVVDVAADFDRAATRAADDRLNDYARRGWQVAVQHYNSYAEAEQAFPAALSRQPQSIAQ